jgi:hypothetical protein
MLAKMRSNIKPARLRNRPYFGVVHGWSGETISASAFPNEANEATCHLQAPKDRPVWGSKRQRRKVGREATQLRSPSLAAFSNCCPIPACGLIEVGTLGCLRHTTFSIAEICRGRCILHLFTQHNKIPRFLVLLGGGPLVSPSKPTVLDLGLVCLPLKYSIFKAGKIE